jgi:hypothetical protein
MNRKMIFEIAEAVDKECGQENGPGSEWLTVFAGKMNPWKPIATAPKDGQLIDLYYPHGGRVTDCFWLLDNWQTTIWDGTLRVVSIEAPTHYMDKPEDPASNAK